MAMQIRWTEQSCRALDFIMTCSRDFYSKKQLQLLRNDISHCESLLSENPLMGAIEYELEGLEIEYRHFVLTKPFKIIYFIYENCIYIADIWDTRQSSEIHRRNFENL